MLNHKGTQTIETRRLILRKFAAEDAEAMFRNWANDPEVTKYLTWPPHGNVDITKMLLENWVADYQKEDHYQWAIVLKENGPEPIGSMMALCNNDIASAHVGYCIGKNWWHKGIMTEALQAVTDFLFDSVGVNRAEARHDPNNPNSGKVMEKCGMRYEGTLRQADRNNQGICDCCYYAILAQDRNP